MRFKSFLRYSLITRTDILTALLGLIFFIGAIPILTYFYFAHDLTSKDRIMNSNDTGLVLLDRYNHPFFTFYQAKFKTNVSLSQISPNMQHAVIASEDKDFYTHPGFSISAIIRSSLADVKQGSAAYGGSTITQQLVKNALLTPNKSFLRKYQEIILAQEIERRYNKNEILEMYLNSVYFGEGAFGIEQAAQKFFGIHAKDLDVAQSSVLAALLPAPSQLSPISGDQNASRQHQLIVLGDMQNQGLITQDQEKAAENEKLVFQTQQPQDINTLAPHFALMVRDELIQKYGEEEVARSGFKVKTTLNSDWQKFAENTVANQVAKLAANNAHNGAAVVLDPHTGEILSLVGSHDWDDQKFGKVNIALSPRQPGSSFKPIVYSRAFERDLITPATVLQDVPTTFPGNYKPHDYDGKFRGPVTARRALANSLNVPAVEVMQKVGLLDALSTAKRFGISTFSDPSNYGLSLVLGAGEVKLLELTDVYATFANKGERSKPVDILQIQDKDNHTIYTFHPDPQRVISEDVAYLITSILSDNTARAEEFGNLLTISRPAAVKTGTTENFRDAWTLGYTPDLTIGVWVGNNDSAQMDNIAGSLGAAPIWRLLMEHFLYATPVKRFEVPSGVVSQLTCSFATGIKSASTSGYLEYFIRGTEPSKPCNAPTISITGVSVSPGSVSPTPPPSVSQTPPPPASVSPSNPPPSTGAQIQIQVPPGKEKH
ncbi:MAG TPA: PBP1A family penicillin-binding protein [Candidatus Saccharimonadales bacterium]|nr:PBP1A family penicillin-binding protein [Candidatus Saccharimonadales bacterium]